MSTGPVSSASAPTRAPRPARRFLNAIALALGVLALHPLEAQGQQPDLVLNVTDTPDPVPAGGTVTYAVSIANNGLGTATGVSYAMTVPSGLVYRGFTAGTAGTSCTGMTVGAVGPGTVTCTAPGLAFGASATFSIRLRLPVQGIVNVSQTVTATPTDADPANNTVTTQTTVGAGANVALTMSAPTTAAAGSVVGYTFTIANAGPDPATLQRITLPLPAGTAVNGALPSGCSGTSTIICDVAGPIASNGSATVGPVNLRYGAGAGSTITASASVALQPGAAASTPRDPDVADNTVTRSTTVTAGSDVRATISRAPAGPYFVGDALTFSVPVSYSGDAPSGLTLTVTLPANYTRGTLAPTQGAWSCSASGQTVTCTRAGGTTAGDNIALGTISIPATAASPGSGIVTSATVTATSPSDPVPGNNTAGDGGATVQALSADLTLSKGGPQPALTVVNQPFTWTIAPRNLGPSAFIGTIAIVDSLPAGATVTAISAPNWSCSPAAPIVGPAEITCTRTVGGSGVAPNTPAGASIVLTAVQSVPGALINVARISSPNANVPDLNGGNDRATNTVTGANGADATDIRLVSTASPNPVGSGDVLTYEHEIVNDGALTAGTVQLRADFQTLVNNQAGAGQGFVGATVLRQGAASAVTCTSATAGTSGRLVTCTIPSLPPCTAGNNPSDPNDPTLCPRIALAIRPAGDGGTRTQVTTAFSQVTADPATGNNQTSVAVTVEPRADVGVTANATPLPVPAGQVVTITATVANAGPSTAAGVTLTDTLPLGVRFVSAVPSTGSCSGLPAANAEIVAGNRVFTCTLGTLARGTQQTVTVRVRPVTGQRSTTLTHVAVAATTTTQPAGADANDVASTPLPVGPPSLDLLVNKTESVDPLTVGDQTVYTITVTNNGPSDAENVVITDTLPATGLSYVSHVFAAGSCATVPTAGSTGGVLACQLARLANGTSVSITVTMQGDAKGVHANRAAVTSDEVDGGFDPFPANNATLENTTVRTRADLAVVSVTPSVSNIALRRPYDWTVLVRNNTGANLAEGDSVVVESTLPAGSELTGTPVPTVLGGTTTLLGCTGAAGATTWRCTFGTVSNGAELQVVVPARHVGVPAGGTATSTVGVTTSSFDPVAANNTGTGAIVINASSVAGTVFRDFDDDGAVDPTDTGIGGIAMTLAGTAFDGAAVNRSATTAAGGTWSFDELPEGSYTITRGTVSETFLVVGRQVAGSAGGVATAPPAISGIALGPLVAATGYGFGFVPQARVGLAKRLVGTPVANTDGTLTATFRLAVRNFALEPLSGVTLVDTLAGAAPRLGAFVAGGAGATLAAGTYTIQAAPAIVGSCAGATAAAGYDGDATPTVATIATLAAAATCEADVTVRYRPTVPLPAGNYANSGDVTAVGAWSAQAVADRSQTGTNPDPNGDGDPRPENAPTPLGAVLAADVTAAIAAPTTVAAGQPVTAQVTWRNTGPYTANGVTYTLQLSPGLAGVSVANLPAGATATYTAGGAVTLAGMPASLAAGAWASGDGATPVLVTWTQNGTANTTAQATIATSTNEGQNTFPNAASATVTGPLVADVTTTLAFPATVDAGQSVTGTVTFRNVGPSTASAVSYALTLAPGLANVSFANLPAGASASYATGTGQVTFANMPATLVAGALASGTGGAGITVAWTQPPSASSAVTASIATATGQGANVAPDAATATIGGAPVADVTTALAFPTSVNAGQPVAGTITFRNDGPSSASGMSYTLQLVPGLAGVTLGNLPVGAGASYDAASGAVSFSNFPATLAAGALASATGTTPITLQYVQPPAGTSTIASTIATTTSQGANVALDAASTTTGGAPVADVRALVIAPAAVDAGQPVAAQLRFSNGGPSPATGLAFGATLPAGLAGVTFGNLPGGATATYDGATGAIAFAGMPTTLAAGALASGDGTAGIAVTWTQPPTATSTLAATIATTTDQGADIAPDADSRTIAGARIADVTATITGLPPIAAPGAPVNARITFRNAGPSPASGVQYGLQLAPGLAGVTVGNLPAGATAQYDATSGTVTFTAMPATLAAAALASGDGVQGIALAYPQPNALRTDLAASIATTTSQGTNALPDAATATVSGLQGTDLVVTKATDRLEVTPRDTLAWRIVVRNEGPVALPAGGTVTDVPVLGTTLVDARCAPVAANACGTAPTAGALLAGVPLPALPVGAAWAVDVRGAVTAADGGRVTNRAIAALPVGYFDTDSTDNRTESGPIPVRARPDVAVTRSVDADTLRVGQRATWRAVATNRGTAATSGPVTVSETFPAGLVPVSAAGATFACTVTGQDVRCVRTDALAPDDSAAVSIVATVAPTVTATALATTACQATSDDVNAVNDCGSVSRPVAGRVALAVAKRAIGDFVVGETGRWALVARNTGTIPVTGTVTLVDTLPRTVTFRAATGAGWRCRESGGVVTCDSDAPIAVGDSATVSLEARIDAPVARLENCTTLAVAGGAVLADGGRACATVEARGDWRLALELTTPRTERELQDVPDFTVLVRNTGRSPLPAVSLTARLPRGFRYVPRTTSVGGMPDPRPRAGGEEPTAAGANELTWPLGDMAPGAVVRLDYRALVGAGATFDADNVTLASARSAVPGEVVASNTAQVPIRLRRGLFDDRGTIAGKVYAECDCDGRPGQGEGEVGIPGVRVVLEDGTAAITDAEGKYNFVNVRAALHVVKVDRSTLPAGAVLVPLGTRNAGDGGSRFVDLKAGELHRADFAEGSRSPDVRALIAARRRAGEPTAAARTDDGLATLLRAAPVTQPLPAPVLGAEPPPTAGVVPTAAPADSTLRGAVPLPATAVLTEATSNLPPTPPRARLAQAGQPQRAPHRVAVAVGRDAAPADGRTVVPVTVRIVDSTGAPLRGSVAVTMETSAGGWRVADGDPVARGVQLVVTDGEATVPLVAASLPTDATVRASTGVAEASGAVAFTPAPRPMMAIGLLQGRVDLRRGAIGAAGDGFEAALRDLVLTRDGGRVAAGARGTLLLKGDVRGAGLLTLAYDTERDPARTQFRDITPDVGWGVFGDGSLREFDAQSRERLYLRLDRGRSFVRYGDFATPRSDERRQLLAYDRSLTGLTWHAEGARGVVNAFASRNRIRQVVDELPGRGLSGPYGLSRANAVINSERVELVTRDRNQPSVILRSQPMIRFEEYTIEPLSGRLVFRAPVPSVDANLNPVTVRVTYEVEQGGTDFMTYGGDGRLRLASNVELGAFAVRDENPLDAQTLLGTSAQATLGRGTTALAEYARTETGVTTLAGEAWRAELRHASSRLEGRVFAMRSDTGFANRSSTFGGGRTELGLKWAAALTGRTRLLAEALRTEDERTGGRRTGALLALEQRLTRGLVVELGWRRAEENGAPVSPVLGGGLGTVLTGGRGGSAGGLAPLSFSAARARLTAAMPGAARTSLFAEYEHAVDASRARRGAIGGEWLAFDRVRTYLRHEWLTSPQGPYALGDDRRQEQTVLGIDAAYLRDAQVFSEYRARDAFNGREAEAAIGLRNRFPLARGVLANTSLERVTPLWGEGGATRGTAFAATGALEWTAAARFKSTARLEWRTAPAGDAMLASLGHAHKLTRDWTFLGRTLWDGLVGGDARGRTQLGLAWRQTDRNRVNALLRLENRLDRADALGLPTSRTVATMAAAVVNVQPVPRLTFSTRLAAKVAEDRRDALAVRSTAQLLMARTIVDVTRRLDVGFIGSVMGDGGFSTRRYGLGAEVGVVPMRNVRIAGGWNAFGFTDRDFASLGATQRGPYLEFGIKFDESLLGGGAPGPAGGR